MGIRRFFGYEYHYGYNAAMKKPPRGAPFTVYVKAPTRLRLRILKKRWKCRTWAELLRALVEKSG